MVMPVPPRLRRAVFRRVLALTAGASFLAPVAGAAQSADTVVVDLAEAERIALERGPALAAALADVELKEAQHQQARNMRYLTEFNLRNFWGPINRQRGIFTETGVLISPDTIVGIDDIRWFTQLELEIVQPLTGFGKAKARIEAAERNIEVAEAGLETARADARYLVRRLYWQAVQALELRRMADDLAQRLAEARETLEERVDEGEASQNELFKFQVFEYEVARRSREVADNLELALEALRAALGYPEGTPLRLADDELTVPDVTLEPLESYLEAARAARPELHQLRAGVLARRSLAHAERRDGWPTLFVAGGLKANLAPSRFDPRNPFWRNETNYFRPALAIGFDWELDFMHHRDAARVQEVEARKLEAQQAPLLAQVEQEVRRAYLAARRAQADVEEGRRALRATENWLRAEAQTYDLGLGDIQDLIDAYQANVQMRTEQLSNIAALRLALAELNRRVGRDVVRVGG